MKTQEKYNGFKNRSTWLVKLHLDNTSKEIWTRVREIAIQANTTKQFKSMITPILTDIPQLWKEQDFDVLKVDFLELWNSLEK